MLSDETVKNLELKANDIRTSIIEMLTEAGLLVWLIFSHYYISTF